MSVEQLEQNVLNLSPEERRRFLDWLFEHEEELLGADGDIHPEVKANILRRREEALAHPEKLRSWETSFPQMKQRFEDLAVKILTPAETDAVDAALWYDAQSPGLGQEFMEEVNHAAERLATNPEIHRIRFEDVRRAPVHQFKFYGLYYLVHNDEVWIIAVHHDRWHPAWLQRRRRQLG